jgi:hypothetical protein
MMEKQYLPLYLATISAYLRQIPVSDHRNAQLGLFFHPGKTHLNTFSWNLPIELLFIFSDNIRSKNGPHSNLLRRFRNGSH